MNPSPSYSLVPIAVSIPLNVTAAVVMPARSELALTLLFVSALLLLLAYVIECHERHLDMLRMHRELARREAKWSACPIDLVQKRP
jgi:hypothetical protein